jgi:anthranilate synthase component 1
VQYEQFVELARGDASTVPVYRVLAADTLTPVTAFLRLQRRGEPAFLLESVEGGARLGRYSFLGRDPFQRLAASGEQVTLTRRGEARTIGGGFFPALDAEVRALRTARVPGLPPLTGGAVGYVGYDAVRWIEKIPDRHPRENALADAELFFYETLVAFDHAKHRVYLIANVNVRETGKGASDLHRAYVEAEGRLDAIESDLERPVPRAEVPKVLRALEPSSVAEGMRANFTKEGFEAAVAAAKEHILAGDAFQIVLSQRFQTELRAEPFDVYRALRALNPSPYLFYLQWEDTALLGSSPETMVRVEDGVAMVRPIAGTRRRGKDAAEDRDLELDLLGDEKELAEHRMLVDLGRNDIGRVAAFGSVRLSRLEEVERYSHVMHIVSQVEGRLRDNLGPVDAFCAGFPAGTVSGAPKIRAMEIIDELEANRRGTYAGAVGYLDFAGNLDTCIAIRTLLIHKGIATVQAGAGIVADSVPEREYLETIHKASAVYDAIRLAEAGAGTKSSGKR